MSSICTETRAVNDTQEPQSPAARPREGRGCLRGRIVGPLGRSLMRALPENRLGDKVFAWINFVRFHRRLPSDAKRYNDVLYRIKTTNEILDPLRVLVSDKELLKLYVSAVVGDQYNVPTIDIIRSVEAVDACEFPAQCAIKPTHASGRVILRRHGEPVDREEIKSWFRINYYRVGREANYRLLRPKVIVEPLLFGSSNVEDYKIFCVDGAPRIIQVDVDRYVGHKRKYFDADWTEQDFSIKYPRTDKILPRPSNLAEMLAVASRLSRDLWFVRVDLYSDGEKIYVGELTHCADNADGRFMPRAAEEIMSARLFR
jgi:TupA-like ATPgrasp